MLLGEDVGREGGFLGFLKGRGGGRGLRVVAVDLVDCTLEGVVHF